MFAPGFSIFLDIVQPQLFTCEPHRAISVSTNEHQSLRHFAWGRGNRKAVIWPALHRHRINMDFGRV